MIRQLQDSALSQSWTDDAVRDTISAIARQAAYNRELGQSIWDRVLRFVFDQLARLFEAIGTVPYGRAIAITLVALAVALVVARLVLGLIAEGRAVDASPSTSGAARNTAQLSEAERLAAQGEYTAAAHALFALVISVGGARGEFRVHSSKTSGDYARELRARTASWFSPFQEFRRRYDRGIYGDVACSADDYQALLREVQRMLAKDRAA